MHQFSCRETVGISGSFHHTDNILKLLNLRAEVSFLGIVPNTEQGLTHREKVPLKGRDPCRGTRWYSPTSIALASPKQTVPCKLFSPRNSYLLLHRAFGGISFPIHLPEELYYHLLTNLVEAPEARQIEGGSFKVACLKVRTSRMGVVGAVESSVAFPIVRFVAG